MSIIYEALKKVEESANIRDPKEGNHSVRNEVSIKTQKEKSIVAEHTQRVKIYLTYVVIIILGFTIANFIFNHLGSPKYLIKELPPVVKIPALEQELPAPLPTASKSPSLASAAHPVKNEISNRAYKESEITLVLNGIFFAKNGCYAIINNQIVKKNDIINGAIVVQITMDEVELEADSARFKLSIKNNKSR